MENLCVCIEEEMLCRFEQIAKQYDRSTESLLLALIKNSILVFEQEHGPIQPEKKGV